MDISLFLKRIYIKLIRIYPRVSDKRHTFLHSVSLNEENLFSYAILKSYFQEMIIYADYICILFILCGYNKLLKIITRKSRCNLHYLMRGMNLERFESKFFERSSFPMKDKYTRDQ